MWPLYLNDHYSLGQIVKVALYKGKRKTPSDWHNMLYIIYYMYIEAAAASGDLMQSFFNQFFVNIKWPHVACRFLEMTSSRS